jgi:hypothetical protein
VNNLAYAAAWPVGEGTAFPDRTSFIARIREAASLRWNWSPAN